MTHEHDTLRLGPGLAMCVHGVYMYYIHFTD